MMVNLMCQLAGLSSSVASSDTTSDVAMKVVCGCG